jgi:hypothetical protein
MAQKLRECPEIVLVVRCMNTTAETIMTKMLLKTQINMATGLPRNMITVLVL